MEPISFAAGIVGLAGLFSVCLDVVDKVDSYKEFGLESRSLVAQFKADKHLFTKWAQDVGIDKNTSEKYHRHLDNQETHSIVQEILSSIQEIFSKTEGTISSLQPAVEGGPSSFPDGIRFLNARQKSQKPEGAISKRSRVGWSLRSKAKFISQVQQFGALVQKLHSLVPPDGLPGPENVSKDIVDKDLSSRNDKDTWFSNSQQLLIEMEKQIERETRKELDAWLSASWTNNVYDNFIRRRLDGTCDWILSQQSFLEWISPDFPPSTTKLLWINGPAGHGKTILCARVVQYLSTMLEFPPAYYFCSSDSESRRDPLNIIRSWVSQIISGNRDAFELACGKWEAKDGRNASQTDIVDLFKSIVQYIPNCTFVVDGLDECTWAEDPASFFESLRQAVADTNTRILILSRDEPEIRYCFRTIWAGGNNQEYQIRPEDVRPDTILFSRSVVDKKLINKSETLKDELSQRMAGRCEGMFLWVKMLEEQLRSGKNKKQLEATIDQAPIALEHLYDRNWAKISGLPENDKLRAFHILRWAALALRPLTVLEVTEALLIVNDDCEDLPVDELPDAIDEDYISTEILGLCGSLLEVRKAEPKLDLCSITIHLTHFSVKQYILCNMPAQGGLLIAERQLLASSETFQSNVLAILCLRYLNFQTVWQESLHYQKDLDSRPFRDYAAGSWYRHIRENGSNYREVVQLTNILFNSKNGNWESWKKWFDVNDDKSEMPESQRGITSTSPLFYASLLGLRDTVIYLLEERKLNVNYIDRFNRTALQAAALKGHTSIVTLLLENGADVAVANQEGWTPLNSASNNGYVGVVKLLLEKGADVTVTSRDGWSPLNSASDSGYVDVVRLLIEKGANVTVASQDGWTPLELASNKGYIDVVNLLLKKGANVMSVSQDGWTPLSLASSKGHIDVVKLLLGKDADITIASQDGWTPLNLASNSGYVDVVRLLLEKGADATITTQRGWTPLNTACYGGHIDVIKLLLEKGVDLTIATQRGWTPLHSASDSGYVDIIKLLLDNGADLAVATQEGWTPLNLASNSGCVNAVKLLLEKGADVTVANHGGWTPLNSASDNGHIDVVRLLLEKGADVTLFSQDRWTPLNLASHKGYVDVVKLLLENGADVRISNQDGWTPLNSASDKGYIDVAKLLLDKGADATSATQRGWTPLHSASNSGHVDVINLLLEKGADVTATTEEGWTPLHSASNSGCVGAVQLLLENGADIDLKDRYGRTPLSQAVDSGHGAVVKLLLATGCAEPDSKDQLCRTPLLYGAKNGNKGIVQLLLETNRVEIDSKDYYNLTPLSIAARVGRDDVVAILLTKNPALDSADSFGRTPLWWARRTGNLHIANLLLEKCKEKGIAIREDNLPPALTLPLSDEEIKICDICVLGISEKDPYYHCGICINGDFDICEECFALDARCLDRCHVLSKETNQENA